MNFDPWNRPLKIWKSIGTPTPKMRVHLGVLGFIPSHSFALLGHEMWLPSSVLACTLQTLALVASPRLGLRQIPRVINQIVECPWDQSPIHSHGPTSLSISSIDDTTDGNPRVWKEMEMNLEVVVQVASYDPFEVKGAKWSKWKGQTHIHHFYILGEQT
jgi:hypothetical protein